MAVLEAVNIKKTFEEGSQRVEVLKGVSLAVRPGEVVALEGPSGSGKTTFLSIIGCILSPSDGKLRVNGEAVHGKSTSHYSAVRRKSIGLYFSSSIFFRHSALTRTCSTRCKSKDTAAHRHATKLIASSIP